MLNFKIEFFSGVFLICDPHWSRIMVQILFSFFFSKISMIRPYDLSVLCAEWPQCSSLSTSISC